MQENLGLADVSSATRPVLYGSISSRQKQDQEPQLQEPVQCQETACIEDPSAHRHQPHLHAAF
jgi:hypothetical protein